MPGRATISVFRSHKPEKLLPFVTVANVDGYGSFVAMAPVIAIHKGFLDDIAAAEALRLFNTARERVPVVGIAVKAERAYTEILPNSGDDIGEAMADLLRTTGPSVLIAHSNSGQYGWATAFAAPDLVKGIVAYEPDNVIFSENVDLPEITGKHPALTQVYIPKTVPWRSSRN